MPSSVMAVVEVMLSLSSVGGLNDLAIFGVILSKSNISQGNHRKDHGKD